MVSQTVDMIVSQRRILRLPHQSDSNQFTQTTVSEGMPPLAET